MTRYLRGFDSLIAYQMRKLNIFDDGERVATITLIDSSFFVDARSSREWTEIKRLADSFDPKKKKFLEQIAAKAHEYNYSTELV